MELSIFLRVGMDGTGYAVRRWREGRDRSEHANTRNGQAGTNGKAVFLLGLPITTAAVLHGEPNWPRLSPERWRDMTAHELQRLLNEGKNITQRDGVGMTALIRATRENSCPEVVLPLLDTGGSPAAQGVDGRGEVESLQDNRALLEVPFADRLRER
jgi:hypothetical protein